MGEVLWPWVGQQAEAGRRRVAGAPPPGQVVPSCGARALALGRSCYNTRVPGGCAGWGVSSTYPVVQAILAMSCDRFKTWNRGNPGTDTAQLSRRRPGTRPGAGKRHAHVGGGDWVTREGPEHPTCLIQTPIPRGTE